MGKDQDLLEAARKGNYDVAEKILNQRAKRSGPLASLRRGPGANVQDTSGYSALHHAALNGHRNIVQLLLSHDASTNIVDSKGSSPLHLAAWSGNLDIVRCLLSSLYHSKCNVNLTNKDDETALHCAAQYGHTDVVSVLLEHACDPGIRNCRGETALDLAAQYGRLDTVELLVRTDPTLIQCLKEATPDTVYPHTPLHLASRNGHKAVVEVLLRAGFNVNMLTKQGTALHEAALCGKVDVVRTLLEHGANPSMRDCNNHTVMDLLSLFNKAQASQEIMAIIKHYKRNLDSDGESISHPFPTVPNNDSDLGSPYENVRPPSKNARSLTDYSPSTSPQRWDFQRHARPPEGFEDRRVSAASGLSVCDLHVIPRNAQDRSLTNTKSDTSDYLPMDGHLKRNTKPYQSLPPKSRTKPDPEILVPLDGISFSFKEKLCLRKLSTSSSWSYHTACDCTNNNRHSNSSRESENSLYHIPCVPRAFMDSSVNSEDLSYLCTSRESDQISLSSTTSSYGYSRRPDSGGIPLYLPMNSHRNGQSPSSANKVSPTPPKKPPRRNLSVSPTHLQPMSTSVDGVTNNSAYEYICFAHTGTKSQSNLQDLDHETRRERLTPGKSIDQYVEMSVFNIALDEEEEKPERHTKELHRGKSEDLDCRKREPVAITSMYENVPIKKQNPKRKLRRNPDVYEEYDFRGSYPSSAPESTFISSAFLMISGDESDTSRDSRKSRVIPSDNFPLSPTHYNQPPTPDHPPPSALQAENIISEKMRPLSQEYKRRSRDMETETEEEYLLIYDESSGSFSSSVSLSDRSVENMLEEYNADAPFAGLIKGSTKVLENVNSNTPAERPKTLKKLKRVYEGCSSDHFSYDRSSSSEKESSDNKENKENKDKERVSALSPFDEQEEWAKIQEIMASFGTGIVRESVFVAELEKEFQNRLLTLSCSQNSLNSENVTTVEKWLQTLGMGDYVGLFTSFGFDDLNFLNGVLEENDLKDMGITSELERQLILDAVKDLPPTVNDQLPCNNNNINENSVANWLRRIHLEQYSDTFAKHLYHDMERIKRIWDVELSAVLDIDKIGHRKRILSSVSSGEHVTSGPKLEEINTEVGVLKNSSNSALKSPSASANSNTGTIRHRHKKSRPAPQPPAKNQPQEKKGPAEIYVGGSNSIKSQWRHQPILLITGVVKYSANYLGSTSILEFKGTESTKKSIQKIRKANDRQSQEITLIISYRGVKFINPASQHSICEHEIRNVNCACQDSENQAYFAYITKDAENFYCHVFEATSSEQATEIILTLGQAFELAYQMAVREQVTSRNKPKPASSPGSVSSHSRDFRESSVLNDLKLNGHPLKMKPLALSIAAEPVAEHQQSQQKTPSKSQNVDIKG